jgi:hypothetical protein
MRGTIVKRPTRAGRARWAYVFDLGKDENGKRRQLTKSGFKTRGDAEAALDKARAEHRDKLALPEERIVPTFAAFFERWHHEVVIRQHSPKTAERSEELAQYAIRLFGNAPLNQLTTAQLATDMNRLLDHGGRVTKICPKGRLLAPKTVRHIAFGVQACLEQAVDWDILPKNPMKKVRKPKVTKRRPKVVDRGGFDALLRKTAGRSIYPVIVLGMATGAEKCWLSNGRISIGTRLRSKSRNHLKRRKRDSASNRRRAAKPAVSPFPVKSSKSSANTSGNRLATANYTARTTPI